MTPAPLALTVLAGMLAVAGAWPEAAGTLRGTVKPVPVSWLLWAGILAEGAGGSGEGGQVPATVFTAANAAACALVAWLAFRVPPGRRGRPAYIPLPGRRVRLDWLCAAGGAAGLVMLTVVHAPGPAVAVSIGTDMIAYAPTVAHAWAAPAEESRLSYALCAAGAVAAVAAIAVTGTMGVFTAVAYPAYLAVMDAAVTVILVARLSRGRALLPAGGGGVPRPWEQPATLPLAWMLPLGGAMTVPGRPDDLIRPVSGPLPPADEARMRDLELWVAEQASLERAAPVCLGHRRRGCWECCRVMPRPAWLRPYPAGG